MRTIQIFSDFVVSGVERRLNESGIASSSVDSPEAAIDCNSRPLIVSFLLSCGKFLRSPTACWRPTRSCAVKSFPLRQSVPPRPRPITPLPGRHPAHELGPAAQTGLRHRRGALPELRRRLEDHRRKGKSGPPIARNEYRDLLIWSYYALKTLWKIKALL